jgi:hypothetical protein
MIRIKRNPTTIKPILFVDHDGCLVIRDQNDGELEDFFDKKSIKILNEIITESDCEIVISSDWRNHYTLKAMGDIYKDSGIIKKPIDYTPDLWTKNSSVDDLEKIRSLEIKTWLNQNSISYNWCAIDDMELLLSNFVLVNPNKGLTNSIKNKVLAFFS